MPGKQAFERRFGYKILAYEILRLRKGHRRTWSARGSRGITAVLDGRRFPRVFGIMYANGILKFGEG
jgi:hypothetical protein